MLTRFRASETLARTISLNWGAVMGFVMGCEVKTTLCRVVLNLVVVEPQVPRYCFLP